MGLNYGTTQYTDTTGIEGQTYTYQVRYNNGCGLNVVTAGAVVTDVDNTPSANISGSSQMCPGDTITLDAGTGYASYLWTPGNETTQTIAVSPSATTIYGVEVSNGICPGSATHILTVLPSPIPQISAGEPSSEPTDVFCVTNGTVNATVESEGILYIGGTFTLVGRYSGSAIGVDRATGNPDYSFPKVTGAVNCVIPDGSGGWYIGGAFTQVGALPRNRLAHILPDHTVDGTWDPNANGTVNAMVLSGSTLYAGGSFTTIGGQTRNRIAALSVSTGTATTWNPNSNNNVQALALSDSTLYVGGTFTTIGGQSRNRIAALDTSTGSATPWNPNSDSWVYALAIAGNTVYVGGDFATIGSLSLNRIAALDATTGYASMWNPNANGSVRSLVLSGGD
jgi:hypothetical protein